MSNKPKIAFLSTYPPTKCGIATFSQSIVREINRSGKYQAVVIQVDKKPVPKKTKEVVFQIEQEKKSSYIAAAHFIDESDIRAVVIEHEYGIYGGQDGEYILNFVTELSKPIVIALHSVLSKHSKSRYRLTKNLLSYARAIIVMTKNAKNILEKNFHIDPIKIKVIPHGVPKIELFEKKFFKKKLGYKNKIVISTYGLIGKGKGIEVALKAIKELIAHYPQIRYLVIGETHPTLLEKEGESYRNQLVKYVEKNKLQDNVIFLNKFLDQKKLISYLSSTDIYLAPQRDLNQAFSGTVAYTMGCGCAVISSATNFAKEVLSEKRGFITTHEPKDLKAKIKRLIDNPNLLETLGKKAHKYVQKSTWDRSARKYLRAITNILAHPEINNKWLPPLNLQHFYKITDNFGIFQHCRFSRPNLKFGYSLDDQARALIFCLKYLNYNPRSKKIISTLETFFDFIQKSVDENGIVHNFFDKYQKPIDQEASFESRSRSFWALSILINSSRISQEKRREALLLLDSFKVEPTGSSQSAAYLLLGYSELKKIRDAKIIANHLLGLLEQNKSKNWVWFDREINWASGIIPYALTIAYHLIGEKKMLETALKTTNFLEKISAHPLGFPNPVGQNGWFKKNGKRAIFDQQPIEAADMVLLYNKLFAVTGNFFFRQKARFWISWYYGNNINSTDIYNPSTGGVYDGLTKKGINLNCGAESVITYFLAYLSFLD